jgi:hypothetical protein
MEEAEFTHPGLRMIRDSDAFTVVLPVKAESYRRMLHLLWFAIWLAGEAALLAGLFGWQALPSPPRAALVAFFAVFTAAGLFVLYRLLWYMAGRETFVVRPDRLTVRREIWGIGQRRTFERRSIRRISGARLDYEVVYPSWGRMFIGHGDGEIVIDSDGRAYSYGKGLEEEEARMLARLILEELRARSQDRRPSELRAL